MVLFYLLRPLFLSAWWCSNWCASILVHSRTYWHFKTSMLHWRCNCSHIIDYGFELHLGNDKQINLNWSRELKDWYQFIRFSFELELNWKWNLFIHRISWFVLDIRDHFGISSEWKSIRDFEQMKRESTLIKNGTWWMIS